MLKIIRQMDFMVLALGLVILAGVMGTFFVIRPQQISATDDALFDQFQRWQPRSYDPEAPVRIVDIDDASLRIFGQWPWPRTYIAEIVRRLTNAGAAVIAFDIVFPEPDRTSPGELARTLPRFGLDYGDALEHLAAQAADHDAILAQMFGQSRVVLATIVTNAPPTDALPGMPVGVAVSGAGGDITAGLERFAGAIPNLLGLAAEASGIGAVVLGESEAGRVRRVPLFVAIEGIDAPYPALSIEALRVALQAASHRVKTSRGSGQTDFAGEVSIVSASVAGIEVPLDRQGRLRVNYSPAVSERVIPAHTLLSGADTPEHVAEEVAGRIVIIGSSAAGVNDLHATPLQDRLAGMHIHAEIIEQILSQDFLRTPDWSHGAEALATLLLGLAVIIALSLRTPIVAAALVFAGVGLVVSASWQVFAHEGLLLSPIGPVLGIAAPYLLTSGMNYIRSEAKRRQLTNQFSQFVAPDVIADIVRDTDRFLTPHGAERELTILFLDMRSFSNITEKMRPQDVVQLVNDLHTPLCDEILAHEGTIDKFIGDAIMAFWNAPRPVADHASRCMDTVMAFQGAMARLNEGIVARGLDSLRIGVGVNSGLCAVGNLGSKRRLAYSCVGDSVNLAARLESLTKTYGVGNLIGEATVAASQNRFAFLAIDEVRVKGREQLECVSTLVGPAALTQNPAFTVCRDGVTRVRAAIDACDWESAIAACVALGDLPPIGLFAPGFYSSAMASRVAELRKVASGSP